MLPLTVSCYQALIELTTVAGSEERFDGLCSIISGSILGAWTYASSNEDTMTASVEALSPLVRGLGIGTVRFLKAGVEERQGGSSEKADMIDLGTDTPALRQPYSDAARAVSTAACPFKRTRAHRDYPRISAADLCMEGPHSGCHASVLGTH